MTPECSYPSCRSNLQLEIHHSYTEMKPQGLGQTLLRSLNWDFDLPEASHKHLNEIVILRTSNRPWYEMISLLCILHIPIIPTHPRSPSMTCVHVYIYIHIYEYVYTHIDILIWYIYFRHIYSHQFSISSVVAAFCSRHLIKFARWGPR